MLGLGRRVRQIASPVLSYAVHRSYARARTRGCINQTESGVTDAKEGESTLGEDISETDATDEGEGGTIGVDTTQQADTTMQQQADTTIQADTTQPPR